MRKPNFSTLIFKKPAAVQAAANLGLTQKRGRGAGETGSIGLMLNYIAAGECLVMLHEYDFDYEMQRAAEQIRALAATESARDVENVSQGLANALDHAAQAKNAANDS